MNTRLEINPFKVKILDLSTVLESTGHAEKPISLRKAATTNSISGTQGYVYPNKVYSMSL